MRKPHIIRIHRPISRTHQNHRPQLSQTHPHKLRTGDHHTIVKPHLDVITRPRNNFDILPQVQIRSHPHHILRLRTLIRQPADHIIFRRIKQPLHRKRGTSDLQRGHPIPMLAHPHPRRARRRRAQLPLQLPSNTAHTRQITTGGTQRFNKPPPVRRICNRARRTRNIGQCIHPMPALTSPCHRPGLVTRMRRRRVQHAGGND